MGLVITVETVELEGGGTALRATLSGEPVRGRVIAIVDQAAHGSTCAVGAVLRALAVKTDLHGFSSKELQ